MKRNRTSNPVKAGIGYSIANIAVKSIGFLTLPIFSRLLTTSEYGVYSVFMSYTTILSYIIGLTLNVSVKRANVEFPNKIDSYTSTASLVYKINFIICIVIVLALGPYLSPLLDLDIVQMILLVFCAEGTAFLALYNAKISLKYSYVEYLIWAAINSIGSIALSIFLIFTLCKDNHLLGRLLGSAIVFSISSIILTIKTFYRAKPSFNREYLKFGIRYSLPIVPNGIAQVLLAQFDRVMIKNMVDDSSAGIYSFASNIKLILTVLVDSIGTVWSTYFFDLMQQNKKEVIRNKATQISILFLLVTILLISISPEIIYIVGTNDYIDGKYVVIPMIVEGFILLLYILVVQGEYYSKKTVFVFLGTCFATIINIVLNYVFIGIFGYIAAAYTTLVSYFLYLVLHLFISRRVIGFNIIPIKTVVFTLSYLALFSAIGVLLIDYFLIRLPLAFVFCVPLLFLLNHVLKKYDNLSIFSFIKTKLFKKGESVENG